MLSFNYIPRRGLSWQDSWGLRWPSNDSRHEGFCFNISCNILAAACGRRALGFTQCTHATFLSTATEIFITEAIIRNHQMGISFLRSRNSSHTSWLSQRERWWWDLFLFSWAAFVSVSETHSSHEVHSALEGYFGSGSCVPYWPLLWQSLQWCLGEGVILGFIADTLLPKTLVGALLVRAEQPPVACSHLVPHFTWLHMPLDVCSLECTHKKLGKKWQNNIQKLEVLDICPVKDNERKVTNRIVITALKKKKQR